MEDCGAVHRERCAPVDPFALLEIKGGNNVCGWIWNDPDWHRYSFRRKHFGGAAEFF